jgi:hypothetical protein
MVRKVVNGSAFLWVASGGLLLPAAAESIKAFKCTWCLNEKGDFSAFASLERYWHWILTSLFFNFCTLGRIERI